MSDVFLPASLRQKAVYWPPAQTDRFGQHAFGEPVEIKCRWDDVQELDTLPSGDKFTTNAKVMVDRDLALNGYLWLGELADAPAEPTIKQNCRLILKFEKIPSFTAKQYVRIAAL